MGLLGTVRKLANVALLPLDCEIRRRPGPPDPLAAYRGDEFLMWLRFANPGMLEVGNLVSFEHALARLPGPQPMVEIGSFCGLSANALVYLKGKYRLANPLFCVDRWEFEGAEKTEEPLGAHPNLTHAEYKRFVKETFVRNVRFFSGHDLPFVVEALSEDFFIMWQRGTEVADVFGRPARLGGPLAFAYIDGNHTYAYARRDFENVDRHLVQGGFVLFDDSGDGSGWDVCRVVAEVKNCRRYELVKANPNYLFRKLS